MNITDFLLPAKFSHCKMPANAIRMQTELLKFASYANFVRKIEVSYSARPEIQ